MGFLCVPRAPAKEISCALRAFASMTNYGHPATLLRRPPTAQEVLRFGCATRSFASISQTVSPLLPWARRESRASHPRTSICLSWQRASSAAAEAREPAQLLRSSSGVWLDARYSHSSTSAWRLPSTRWQVKTPSFSALSGCSWCCSHPRYL